MLLALALLAIGTGLTRPPLFGLLSNLAPANEQGATIGVAQSAGALARIIGPMFAAILYLRIAPLPYVFCGGLAILAAALHPRDILPEKSVPVVAVEFNRSKPVGQPSGFDFPGLEVR